MEPTAGHRRDERELKQLRRATYAGRRTDSRVCRGNGGAVSAAMEGSGAAAKEGDEQTGNCSSAVWHSFGCVKMYQIRPTRFPPPKLQAWSRNLNDNEAATLRAAPHSENARLSICRRAGWDRIPSNEYVLEGLQLKGRGRGHGVGLCQVGAAKMAANGVDYLAILRHYFPNSIVGLTP